MIVRASRELGVSTPPAQRGDPDVAYGASATEAVFVGVAVRIVALIELVSRRVAAASGGASRATGYRLWRRYQEGGWAGLRDRPSMPSASRGGLSAEAERRSWRRAAAGRTGPVMAGAADLGRPPSTVGKVLRRAGCSRLPRPRRGSLRAPLRARAAGRAAACRHQEAGPLLGARQTHPRRGGVRTQPPRRLAAPARRDRRPHPPRLRRAAQRRARARLRRFSERAVAWYAEHGITSSACSPTTPRPTTPALATSVRRARHPAPLHPALPPLDERQSRSADQNDAARMGLPPHLPDQQPPSPRPRRLPPLVQPTTTPRLARSPATDQPRLTRVWSLQLAGEKRAQPLRIPHGVAHREAPPSRC